MSKTYALVYQGGIANVFQVFGPMNQYGDARGTTVGMLQSSHEACYWYAKGLKDGGGEVWTYACDRPGSIRTADWDTPMTAAMFAGKIKVV